MSFVTKAIVHWLQTNTQELLGHLRWMLQKDLLKQDMFLIGCVVLPRIDADWRILGLMHSIATLLCHSPPGASRRLLSMRFCELLNKEVEYIAISQDTTESDLKQVHWCLS